VVRRVRGTGGPAARRAALGARAIRRIVHGVVAGERREADVSVTFVGPARMRLLHREWKGRDRATDVLSFALPQPGGALAGDVYVCPAVAREQARAHGVPLREELARLVIHGTLHVLGYDHPDDDRRTRSAMWQRQERYVRVLA
jgi:probable rRNA maturation factor